MVAAVLALGAACTKSSQVTRPGPEADAGPPPPPPPPPIPFPVARECGEAGPVATPLPPALFDGMIAVGDTVVRPGDKRKVGGFEAEYAPDAWIGTMEAGGRGPALQLLIDKAEAGEHMPWGSQLPLYPNTKMRSYLGPYRYDVRASAEDPPKTVDLHVDKRACPDHAIIPPPSGPIWMWASTEAIRLFTVDLQGQLLQIMVDSTPEPRLEVKALGWSQRLDPRPGPARRVRIDGRVITIEQIEPGKGPRSFSVLAKVETAAALPPPPPPGPATACGIPAAGRTSLPPELTAEPRARGEVTLAAGQKRKLGGVELTATAEEYPARPGPGHQPEKVLRIMAMPLAIPSSVTFGAWGAPEPMRTDRALITVEAVGGGSPPAQVRAHVYPLACGQMLAQPAPTQTTHVWLSTIGTSYVTFGASDRPALKLEVTPEGSLLATSPAAMDSRKLGPDAIGHVATLDGLRILVTDAVVARTGGPFPIVHVQVRIDPL